MAEEARIKNWLAFGNYHNPEVALRDILLATNHYQGLSAQQETYTFNDGTPRDLVSLTGTIPVTYKGFTYNIPICIWLMDTHPRNAPICYVKPTTDMSIKVSMYVDQSGKIYLPYLHDWVPSSSDLLGLIQVMIVTFGDYPPVFSRPKETPSVYGMPQPGGETSYVPFPTPYGGAASGGYGGYPTPYPPAGGSGFPSAYPPYPTSSFPPYPTTNFDTQPAQPTIPAAAAASGPGGGGGVTGGGATATGTIKEEHIRESLLSAIEDKLKRRMKEQLQQSLAELETLQRTQEELKQGEMKLQAIMSRLEKEENDLNKNITLLQDKEQELDKAIERLSNQEPIEVDEAVITTAPLYKQLLNAFAEEAALEDAIYYMGEALRSGVIDIEIFLRQVRTLSRKQFMLRALIEKCRRKAGLAV